MFSPIALTNIRFALCYGVMDNLCFTARSCNSNEVVRQQYGFLRMKLKLQMCANLNDLNAISFLLLSSAVGEWPMLFLVGKCFG